MSEQNTPTAEQCISFQLRLLLATRFFGMPLPKKIPIQGLESWEPVEVSRLMLEMDALNVPRHDHQLTQEHRDHCSEVLRGAILAAQRKLERNGTHGSHHQPKI